MLNPLSAISILLLGSMLLFALLARPSAHTLIDAESDAVPIFYLWGIAISAAGSALALYQRAPAALLMLTVLAGYLYTRQILCPHMNRARELWQAGGSAQAKAHFNKMHKRGMLTHAIQVVLLAVLIYVGWAR